MRHRVSRKAWIEIEVGLGKGGRYETKKTRNKADVCRSHGGSYGAVRGGCERLGSDECEGGNCISRECAGIIGDI